MNLLCRVGWHKPARKLGGIICQRCHRTLR
jgi:hypothetical protein